MVTFSGCLAATTAALSRMSEDLWQMPPYPTRQTSCWGSVIHHPIGMKR